MELTLHTPAPSPHCHCCLCCTILKNLKRVFFFSRDLAFEPLALNGLCQYHHSKWIYQQRYFFLKICFSSPPHDDESAGGEREPKLKLNLSETFHFYFPASIVFPAIQLKLNLSETFLVQVCPSASYKEFWINVKTEIDEHLAQNDLYSLWSAKNWFLELIVKLFYVVLNGFEDIGVYFTDLPSNWMVLGLLFKMFGTAYRYWCWKKSSFHKK